MCLPDILVGHINKTLALGANFNATSSIPHQTAWPPVFLVQRTKLEPHKRLDDSRGIFLETGIRALELISLYLLYCRSAPLFVVYYSH
jgi:hypothetical protein